MPTPDWTPIDQYDFDKCQMAFLAAWIVPSDEAHRNGSRAHWINGVMN